MREFVAQFRGHGLVPGETKERIEADTFREAFLKAEAMEQVDERHWTLVMVRRLER